MWRQHVGRRIEFDRFPRHPVHYRAGLILHNDDRAFVPQQLQFLRSVLPHARKQ